MINYSALHGNQSVLFHYKSRLISSFLNKLFYNVINPGVIENFVNVNPINANGDISSIGIKIKVLSGLTFFIKPNNRYVGGQITSDFNLLSTTQQNILERQILKCNITEDFIIEPEILSPGVINTNKGYIVAEFNYLEFEDQKVEFFFTNAPSVNHVILGQAVFSAGYIQNIDFTNQTKSQLNSQIYYNMNVDELSGYHVGNGSGYIPISNGIINEGLNSHYINGYRLIDVARKWKLNTSLNAEYLADEFRIFYKVGNAFGDVPLSNKNLNNGLNGEYLGGQTFGYYSDIDHIHNLDYITDGVIFKKVLDVDTNHQVTNDSFSDGEITSNKFTDECMYAKNDDLGGQIKIVTGEITTSTNLTLISFNKIFNNVPLIMLQLVSSTGTAYDIVHNKYQAIDVTNSNFTLDYTSYRSTIDGNNYVVISPPTITLQWMAVGYGEEEI